MPSERQAGSLQRLLTLSLLLAGYAACLATLLGFAGRHYWLLTLFAHFRVQYAAGLLLVASMLLLLRSRGHATVMVVFAGVNLALIAPLYWGGGAVTPTGASARAMTFNVNTQLGDPVEAAAVIQQANPDILVLQEISSEWLRDLAPVLSGYPHNLAIPQSDNFGICLFSRYPLKDAREHVLGGANAPSITALVELPGGEIQIIATHPLPPMSPTYANLRNEQLSRLPSVMDASRPRLLLGDLNATPWDPFYQQLLTESGLRDSSRGYGWQPTWPAQVPVLYLPLDHCFHSADIAIINRKVGPYGGSDHRPLIVDFALVE